MIRLLPGRNWSSTFLLFFDIGQPAPHAQTAAWEEAAQSVIVMSHGADDVLSDVSLQVSRGKVTLFADQHTSVLQRIADVIKRKSTLQCGELKTYGRFGEDCIIYEILQNPTRTMLFYNLSVMDNLCFHLDNRLSKVWKPKRIRKNVENELHTRLNDLLRSKDLNGLSKTELYDLVYCKCLLEKPDLAILMCPVDNTDIDLRRNVLEYIRILSQNDIAVLILSTDFSLSASPLIEHAYRMEPALPVTERE